MQRKIAVTVVAVTLAVAFVGIFLARRETPPGKVREPTPAVRCQSKHIGVRILVTHRGTRIDVSCKPFLVPWEGLEVFANGKKLEYERGTGNYYEKYETCPTSLLPQEIVADTLRFTLTRSDTRYTWLHQHATSENILGELTGCHCDRPGPGTTVEWYSAADSLNLYRSNTCMDSVGATTFYSTDVVRRGQRHAPIHLPPSYFKADSGLVTSVECSWGKTVHGVITDNRLCGEITARAEGAQYVYLRASREGETRGGRRTGKWKIFFDKDWKEATVTKEVAYYRIIDYRTGPPWPVTDYYLSGRKQFEGTLTATDPDKMVGAARFYFADGVMAQAGSYDEQGKTGDWKFYHWNGQLKAKGPFAHDQEVGVWEFYDEAGKLTSTEKYGLRK